MSMEQTGAFCHHCQQPRLFTRAGCNHLIHGIVTVLLCGLWLPIWMIAALSTDDWRCTTCGSTPGPAPAPPPASPATEPKASPRRGSWVNRHWLPFWSSLCVDGAILAAWIGGWAQKLAATTAGAWRRLIGYFTSPF